MSTTSHHVIAGRSSSARNCDISEDSVSEWPKAEGLQCSGPQPGPPYVLRRLCALLLEPGPPPGRRPPSARRRGRGRCGRRAARRRQRPRRCPMALVGRPGAGGALEEGLARRPAQDRKAERGQRRQSRQRREGMFRQFGEAQPGIEDDSLRGDPARRPRRPRARPSSAATSAATSSYDACAYMSARPSPVVHQHDGGARRAMTPADRRIVGQRADVVDDRGAGVDRANRRPRLCRYRRKSAR